MNEVEFGLSQQWARFRFEDGRLVVGILTMYKEGEDVIRPATFNLCTCTL